MELISNLTSTNNCQSWVNSKKSHSENKLQIISDRYCTLSMDLQLCNSSQLTKWPRANKTIWDSTVGVNCNMQKFHSYHLLQTDLCSSTPAPHNTGHMHLSATMATDLLWMFHSSINTWHQSLPGVVHRSIIHVNTPTQSHTETQHQLRQL